MNSISVNLFLVFLCIVFAGLASGLTQGLLNLDQLEMKIKSRSGTEVERVRASRVLPLIEKHHLLLVTLMLWNASATEALPIFLNNLVPEWVAIIVSVTLVLLVGEIIPASILTGPRQLELSSSLSPLVYVVGVILFPIAFPISKLLDYTLGHDGGVTVYKKQEIATMMMLQMEEGQKSRNMGDSHGDILHHEEVEMIGNALKFREMTVSEVMTPLKDVFCLSLSENLGYKTLSEIFKYGYSRIPVYNSNTNDMVGLLLAKDLIFVDPEDETPLENFINLFGRGFFYVWPDDKLGYVLNMFKKSRLHLAVVRTVNEEDTTRDPFYQTLGIITMEDILEEILGDEIEDETDQQDDVLTLYRNRDVDLARLRLLNSKMMDEKLSEAECAAVVAHLVANVPQVMAACKDDIDCVRELVQRGTVFNLKRKSVNPLLPTHDDYLFKRLKISSSCILILNGKLQILAGKDGFKSEIGAWSILGTDALSGDFVPDFTAFVISDSLRGIRFSVPSTLQPGTKKEGRGDNVPGEQQKQQQQQQEGVVGRKKPQSLRDTVSTMKSIAGGLKERAYPKYMNGRSKKNVHTKVDDDNNNNNDNDNDNDHNDDDDLYEEKCGGNEDAKPLHPLKVTYLTTAEKKPSMFPESYSSSLSCPYPKYNYKFEKALGSIYENMNLTPPSVATAPVSAKYGSMKKRVAQGNTGDQEECESDDIL